MLPSGFDIGYSPAFLTFALWFCLLHFHFCLPSAKLIAARVLLPAVIASAAKQSQNPSIPVILSLSPSDRRRFCLRWTTIQWKQESMCSSPTPDGQAMLTSLGSISAYSTLLLEEHGSLGALSPCEKEVSTLSRVELDPPLCHKPLRSSGL